MQLYRDFPQTEGPTVLAIGVFDGLHLGHQALIAKAKAKADQSGHPLYVLTFGDHPDMVVRGAAPLLLMSPDEKVAALGALGVERVVLVPFTPALAAMPPERFVSEILAAKLQAAVVCVGYNFRFGRRASGSVETLQALGPTYGFEPQILAPVHDGDEVISSSRIRQLLKQGDLAQAIRLLGHPYALSGTVGHGRQIGGATLKTPTANLQLPERKLVPMDGVYAATVDLDGKHHQAVVNIGIRPTFAGTERAVEVHLLDYQGDLYGRPLSVALRHYLRPEKRFPSPDELRAQIGRDIAKAKQLLANVG